MKIGILEAGRPPEELDAYSSFGKMMEHFITRSAGEGFDFASYPVLDGVFPESIQECDGWIITGSKHGVYENLPWMLTLQDAVRDIHAAGLPLIGICFGHQIIAEALGGKVEKSHKGWGVGLHDYAIAPQAPDWMNTDSGHFTLNVMHQDQVIKLPQDQDTQVLASSEFCEYAALLYGDSIITFQGHPEFSNDFETDLIKLRSALIPDTVSTPALQRLSQEAAREDGPVVSNWAVDFFRRNHPSNPA